MEDRAGYKTKRRYHDALDDILDRPIAFNPAFKRITGSSNAAILLSQGFFWTKRTSDPDGWFWKTRQEWMEETALTEAELDGAREKCRACGVWEEKLAGVPATLHYRINKQKVYELLGVQIPTFPESGFPQNSQIPENPESGNYGNFNKESENTSENTSDFSETKKPDLVDGILEFELKPSSLRNAVHKHFRLNVDWDTKFARQWMEWAHGENITPELIESAAKVWRSDKLFNWQPPTLKGIYEKWPQLMDACKDKSPVKTRVVYQDGKPIVEEMPNA